MKCKISQTSHSHQVDDRSSQAILRALALTLVFMVIELIGGWVSNSLTLLADSFHMLTDASAMSLSLFVLWLVRKPITPTFTYGYYRAEVLGALFSTLMIWGISGLLIYKAILRFYSSPEVQAPLAFFVSTLGVLANIWGLWILHSAKHHSLNAHATYLHIVSDLLGSLSAIFSNLILWITHWSPIDSLLTIGFSCLMMISSWKLVLKTIRILMESTPPEVEFTHIQMALKQIPGVLAVHDLHIWSISNQRHALSVHLVTHPQSHLLLQVTELIQKQYGIHQTTIQIEPSSLPLLNHGLKCNLT